MSIEGKELRGMELFHLSERYDRRSGVSTSPKLLLSRRFSGPWDSLSWVGKGLFLEVVIYIFDQEELPSPEWIHPGFGGLTIDLSFRVDCRIILR